MDKRIYECLVDCPIISAVRNDMFEEAVNSPCKLVFLLDADILSIKERIEKLHSQNKKAFVHIDLASGIGKDGSGIEFLKNCGADGIISTKIGVIRIAKEKGMSTVQRIFALDSQGVFGAIDSVKQANPDFIEVMPGIAFKVVERISVMRIPVIAGGLIDSKAEVFSALDVGAIAVSTGKKELWYM